MAAYADCSHKFRGDDPSQSPGRKRLVICCDGTWNNTNEAGSGPPTNVARLSGAVAHKCCSGMTQIVYYHPGAGTETSKTARVIGGAFGIGIGQDIVESYRFICDNYNPGDEIIIIGFSRGAFTARSIAGMVCALGFLNRAGLDQLGKIFHDYETWQSWGDKKFDPKDAVGPLTCLTLENLKRLKRLEASSKQRQLDKDHKEGKTPNKAPVEVPVPNQQTDDELETALKEERARRFKEMAALKTPDRKKGQSKMQLGKIAELYRKMLADHGLSLAKNGVPFEGKVKAVGVWDTVGSLGIPEIPPFYHAGRSEQELKFEGLDVHPNVEHAFHAIALDEWRTSFDCTLWGLKGNTKTNLRQVWFPGTHCNVGGGWEDQQIATIALAWMADQLTSVGVEFNGYEMRRIFYHINKGVIPRKWGLGLLRNPNGSTSYPDWLWSYAAAPYRKVFGADGLFTGSTDYITRTPGGYKQDGSEELVYKPCEFVHPCVRLRYLYGGLNMDDMGPWGCRALAERGYQLERREVLPDLKVTEARRPFHTIRGPVEPYTIEQPTEELDLAVLPKPTAHWVWVDKKGRKDQDGKVFYLPDLPEEQVGMWERMFIQVNEKILTWKSTQEAKDKDKDKPKSGGFFGNIFGGSEEKKEVVTEVEPVKERLDKVGLKDKERKHGYHDFIVWQWGNPAPTKA
ncbi:hypothetical protein QBC35DRAFT_504961 [Podospora australis]|uniref:T6SS Phospholipase effector Tle1-like catalytic domain-containing protein n=1 Tax=Podospora australis TaxID=1536484 RepID=A0AAN6WP79_9PEZI|nr:hypothetical protein QBC35DRAFT_504961 [Podospora australis]